MKKRKILNALMVLIVIAIAVCGFMAVKSLKGNSTNPKEMTAVTDDTTTESSAVVSSDITGIVTVERSGIAYEVDENSEIKNGDVFRTKVNSAISFLQNESEILTLGANTELKVLDAGTMSLELIEGEAFVDRRNSDKEICITTENAIITPNGTTYSVTAHKSAYTVYVYSGEVSVSGSKLSEELIVNAGKTVSLLNDENGKVEVETRDFSAASLSDWQLSKLRNCNMDEAFCFARADIDSVVENRETEKQAALQAQLLIEEQAKTNLEEEQKKYDEAYSDYQHALKNGTSVSESADEYYEVEDYEYSESSGATSSSSGKYCTIEIRCNTILDNMSDLSPGKESYVPSNGIILPTSKVSFSEGETVFEVLKRACSTAGIQLEYSWTPLYESYYIEGINHLYEFDCGEQSGWMYKVNGWYPNYGCSSYELSEGDVIVWTYTCKGLGADVSR